MLILIPRDDVAHIFNYAVSQPPDFDEDLWLTRCHLLLPSNDVTMTILELDDPNPIAILCDKCRDNSYSEIDSQITFSSFQLDVENIPEQVRWHNKYRMMLNRRGRKFKQLTKSLTKRKNPKI
jgi:hypothetical protein